MYVCIKIHSGNPFYLRETRSSKSKMGDLRFFHKTKRSGEGWQKQGGSNKKVRLSDFFYLEYKTDT